MISLVPESKCDDVPTQSIVPQNLLDLFVQLAVAPSDDAHYICAYWLPAVITTLKKENFHILAPLMKRLSTSPNPQARDSLAQSLHEFQKLLDPELFAQHILPILDLFMMDSCSRVRNRIMKHMPIFLKVSIN